MRFAVRATEHSHVIAARRRVPYIYVVDSAGDVVLRATPQPELSDDGQAIVRRLLAAAQRDETLYGLSDENEVLRLIPLDGERSRHFVLFVEYVAQRDVLGAAAERFGLSAREREVLHLLLHGASTSEIAAQLAIAQATVITHVRNIGCKLNTTKRKEIVAAVLAVV